MSRGQDSVQLGLIVAIGVIVVVGLLGPEHWRAYTTNIGLFGFLMLFWYRGIMALPRTRAQIGLALLYTLLALAYWGWLIWA